MTDEQYRKLRGTDREFAGEPAARRAWEKMYKDEKAAARQAEQQRRFNRFNHRGIGESTPDSDDD